MEHLRSIFAMSEEPQGARKGFFLLDPRSTLRPTSQSRTWL
jgi:hypothetical protein